MRRVLIALIGVAASLAIAANTHLYNAQNTGVVVGPEQAHVGLEVRGQPGLFVGFGSWEWNPGS